MSPATATPSSDSDIIVKLRRVSVRFQNIQVLDTINLDIRRAEHIALEGPSGSGKTTLLMMLSGLEKPSEGEIFINHRNLNALNEDERARLRRHEIGIVFQGFHLAPAMSALENVMLPLEFARHHKPRAVAKDLLDRVGLGHRLNNRPSQLSGGEKQRVALARALAPRPRLLLADEPTGNLDRTTGEKIINLIFSLAEAENMALLIVTHDPAIAQRCRQRLFIRDGRLA